jgi:hypothetical protein
LSIDVIFSWFAAVLYAVIIEDSQSHLKASCNCTHLEWYFLDQVVRQETFHFIVRSFALLWQTLSIGVSQAYPCFLVLCILWDWLCGLPFRFTISFS